MALPTIVLNNATASDIELKQLAVIVPGSGSVAVSDSDSPAEVLNDIELQAALDSGDITVSYQGNALTLEQSKALIQPITALHIKHNLTATVDPAVSDDDDSGYSVGSVWVNTNLGSSFRCVASTTGAAIWEAGGGGASSGGAQVVFGADQVSSTTSTRYLFPGYAPAIAQTSPVGVRVSRPGTMKNMYISQIGDGNGTNLTYTLRVNGAPTLLAVTLASTDSTGSDTTNQIAVSAADVIDIEVTKAGGLGSSPDEVTCSIEFA